MVKTLVLQSHAAPLPHLWLDDCIASVAAWARAKNYAYEFIGDALFDFVAPDIISRAGLPKIIASDIARLGAAQHFLDHGIDTFVWMDADFLIFNPDEFSLPDESYALGREVWVQRDPHDTRKLVVNKKVHNAFLMFRKANPFLAFYIDCAERLLRQNEGKLAPQFIGPKLLTAIHNVVQCPVLETAGMLSPLVLADIANDGGAALDRFRQRSTRAIHGANLCSSLAARGEIADDVIERCIGKLGERKAV